MPFAAAAWPAAVNTLLPVEAGSAFTSTLALHDPLTIVSGILKFGATRRRRPSLLVSGVGDGEARMSSLSLNAPNRFLLPQYLGWQISFIRVYERA